MVVVGKDGGTLSVEEEEEEEDCRGSRVCVLSSGSMQYMCAELVVCVFTNDTVG